MGSTATTLNRPVFSICYCGLIPGPSEILDNKYWQHVKKAVKMRNELVHGAKAYKLEECKEMAKKNIALTDHTIEKFKEIYGFDGWEKVTTRIKSRLHSDPKIKIA